MAWPTVTSGQTMLASQYNALSASIPLWQGAVNSNGYALSIAAATAATSSNNVASPSLVLQGSVWSGSAPINDYWSIYTAVGSGANPLSSLVFGHAGGTGSASVNFGNASLLVSGAANIQTVTPSTSTANQSSPLLNLIGTYWTGSASAVDSWQFQNVLGTGANPSSTLTLTHSGSTGATNVSVGSSVTATAFIVANPSASTVWGLTLTGAGSANSGIHLINTTASTGKDYSLGSNTTGDFFINDNTAGATRLTLNATGLSVSTVTITAPSGQSANILSVNLGAASQFRIVPGSGVISDANFTCGTATLAGAVTFSSPAGIVFGSNWITYSPAISPGGSMTLTNVTFGDASYLRVGPICFVKLSITFTVGGTPSYVIFVGLPVAQVGALSGLEVFTGPGMNYVAGAAYIPANGSAINIYPSGFANYPTGSNTIVLQGFYRVA